MTLQSEPTHVFQPFDLASNLRNCRLLCAALDGDRPEAAGLKQCFGAALNLLQGTHIAFVPGAVLVTFDDADVPGDIVAQGLLESRDLEDGHHLFDAGERAHVMARIGDAVEFIRAVDADLSRLILELIGTICVFRRDGRAGGSVSTATGLIWLNPLSTWTVVDYAENIVHEYIHNSVFLTDMVETVFCDPAHFESPENLVASAILRIPRPYDKSFHSAVVAHGLHDFLIRCHQTERAGRVVVGLRPTVEQLVARQSGQLADAGRSLLAAVATPLLGVA